MDDAPESLLVLRAWLVFLFVSGILCDSKLAAANSEHAGRKLAANIPGSISIDCGVTSDYLDDVTGIFYKSDTDFISTGTNEEISPEYFLENPYYGRLVKNLRTFPQGKKNCYTLKPEQGKGNKYLITTFFNYANYDNKNQTFQFDVYIGVNFWTTLFMQNSRTTYIYNIIHVPSSDVIFLCLVNTGSGIPFISALELRPLDNSIYPLDSGTALYNWYRADVGPLEDHVGPSENNWLRYRDDFYDRMWPVVSFPQWAPISTSNNIETQGSNDAYKVPAQVLRTAVQPSRGYDTISFTMAGYENSEFYVYFHFTEVFNLTQGQKRKLYITLNGVKTEPIITLDYLKPLSIRPHNAPIRGPVSFVINRTADSDLPPILNAFEIYKVLQFNVSATNPEDVVGIMEIKETYGITRDSWQGDPCVPLPLPSRFIWNGLICSPLDKRIISLNLSSSLLKGNMSTSISNLKAIQSLNLSYNELIGPIPDFLVKLSDLKILDLSYNNLTGPIPDFLAEMPNLTTLNLNGNKLIGSVPDALLEKFRDGRLKLSVENMDSCQSFPCKKKKKKKFVIPIVASSVALLILLVIFSALTIYKKKRQGEMVTKYDIKLKNRQYSYSEVVRITNNFKSIIGEGGFGKVYFGTLKDGTQVAIKLLSSSSKQGYKEFQTEAELLIVVHHRNLVSMVGYCDEGESKALIYEYMANGNLYHHLSATNTKVLNWNERLQIAVDAAQGLEYLHNGCTPSIIHRDLKTTNILLNERMQAKIADFGLSKAFVAENVSHVSTCPAGTLGYLDPEFQSSGNLNKKSDVYSFGIIVFELITGRPAIIRGPGRNIHILDWINPIIQKGDIQSIMDPRLQGEIINSNSAWKTVEIAKSCIQPAAIQRPDMSHVLAELKECLALEMVHGRTQMMVTNGNETPSTNSFKMTPSEVESAIFPYAR